MSQTDRLQRLLSDGAWHSTREIVREVYNMDQTSIARVGARVNDLKKLGFDIESRPSQENRKIWEYRLKVISEVLPSCCVPLVFKTFGNYKTAQCPRCAKNFYEKAA